MRRQAHVRWSHLAFYAVLLIAALAVGGTAVWSFIAKQSLAIEPEPLPKVAVVSRSPSAPGWVKLLSRAEMPSTLVDEQPVEGVVLLCDARGALAFVGRASALDLRTEAGTSDATMRLSEAVSPVLARLDPGREIRSARGPVPFLEETSRMVIDARWSGNARAVIMHMEEGGRRYLWFGFDPNAIGEDRHLLMLLRAAFRWVDAQPVSDGAVGAPQIAKTLTPAARLEARRAQFAFSVDSLKSHDDMLTIRMTNRGKAPLSNPTVKIWLPPHVTRVELAGDIIMRRNATVIGVPEDRSCLVSLPRLEPHRERVIKLKIK